MRLVLVFALLSATSTACAGGIIHHDAPSEDVPHIAWELAVGERVDDMETICSSRKPDLACVLPASTAEQKQIAFFTLHLHAAAQTVGYIGTLRLEFLQSAGRTTAIQESLPPGSDVKTSSISDLVTSEPGEYKVHGELRAAMGETSRLIPIAIRVTVRGQVAESVAARR